jgi:hypothetical protein
MAEKKVKEPLVSLLLSIILPGMGHVYSDEKKRGVLFVAI